MAKLSTQAIRDKLINRILEQGSDYTNMVAKELDKELVRTYTTKFGYTQEQADQALEHARRVPQNIVNQYFHMHDDAWLRAQHKIWFPNWR